ncbi:MAG: FAD-dependent oxidoreductase [Silicimonas sp.]|nr:FAD-dependent oxidoreductase [Silicimonas sp.]
MKKSRKTAIIGAGLAGLACARELTERGADAVIFEKGRGLGGRLSTRRADGGIQFDHGAQYLVARNEGFLAMLQQAEAAGFAARWPLDCGEPAFVGTPGMTGLAKYLAPGLNIRKGVRITQILPSDGGWRLDWDNGSETFDQVVITAPAPQTADLLPRGHAMAKALEAVAMTPCLALMVGLPKDVDVSLVTADEPTDEIAWIARDDAKPGRPDTTCIIAHASPEWSAQHLELEFDEIAARMLPLVSEVIGYELTPDALYVAAHRWRYGLVTRPLGQPCLVDETGTLFAGGDWCLGPTAGDAWISGRAIADALVDAV